MITPILYTALIVLLSASCSPLEMTTSTPLDPGTASQQYYFDPDSQIRYMVSNDNDTLHLHLVTGEQSTITQMLRQGTSVYFNLQGKKKKTVCVRYPLTEQLQGNMPSGRNQEQGSGQRPDPATMLQGLSADILFVNNDQEELIQPSALIPSDIHCELSFDRARNLVYDLKIPFYRISEQGLASIEQLSIGVVAEAMQRGGDGSVGMGEGRSGGMGGGRSGGMGGGRSGGMGGGRSGGMGGGPPMGGGSMGGGRSGGMDREAIASPAEFWFLVDLYRK